MRLIGLMPVRNEDWILGLTARAALMWCDALVILDHASTDQTNQIAYESQRDNSQKEIAYLREDDPTWHEQAHRQRMLEVARKMKATHIVTIDADELLTGNLLPDIRDMIEVLSPGEVLQLPWIATQPLRASPLHQRSGRPVPVPGLEGRSALSLERGDSQRVRLSPPGPVHSRRGQLFELQHSAQVGSGRRIPAPAIREHAPAAGQARFVPDARGDPLAGAVHGQSGSGSNAESEDDVRPHRRPVG